MKKTWLYFPIIFVVLLFLDNDANAQKVIRGPYLQNLSPTSITIRWRTDSLTNSRVKYGTDLNSLTATIDSNDNSTEHRIIIEGLTPYTNYFYSVGTSTAQLAGPDSANHFITAPLPDTEQPIRVWAIGDFGRGNKGQRDVMDSYLNYTGNTHTDVWLWLGDNVYVDGTDQEYQDKVFDSIKGYHQLFKYMPFSPCPGNHDYGVISPPGATVFPPDQTGPYFDIIDVPTQAEAGGVPSGTELYYSFDYGNVHFVSINSEIGSVTDSSHDWIGTHQQITFAGSPMIDWLEADLAANTKTWTIVYWHQPPYSSCDQVNSDDLWQFYLIAMRENFVPIMDKYGVDLVVNGHSHIYQRSHLIQGHYGLSSTFDSDSMMVDSSSGKFSLNEPYVKLNKGANPNKGTVYVTIGNSGGDDNLISPLHPTTYFADGGDTIFGSFIIDINANRLDGKYLQTNSGQILDEFTILKQDWPTDIKDVNSVLDIEISLYPNPTTDQLIIEYDFKQSNIEVELILYSMIGEKEKQVKLVNSSGKLTLSLSELRSGLYLYNLVSSDNVLNKGKLAIIR